MNQETMLLTEYQLTDQLKLKNRIVMAPMTRVNATDDLVPTEAMANYYARRADAGLIITEGTVISHDARGHKRVPGIFTPKQIQQWQRVTDKVHEQNGIIFSQIWHVGRVSHPDFLQGNLPISSSETVMTGGMSRSNGLTFGKSREASLTEIKAIIEQYAKAAENAIQAGFDGIEIHGANGYLIDQFLHYDTNKRLDNYGGSPENMARFALEVVKACVQAIGCERVGIRLSPGAYLNQIVGAKNDAVVFQYLLAQINDLNLAYVHTGNFNDAQKFKELNGMSMTAFMRQHYEGTLIACGSYSFAQAAKGIAEHLFDLVAFGRPFIANPDLVERFVKNQTLVPYDVSMLNSLD